MGYFAEIDNVKKVARVIVAPSLEWCETRLGGTWVETNDPYQPYETIVVGEDTTDPENPVPLVSDHPLKGSTYAGPGMGHDPNWPERFAPEWRPWSGNNEDLYQVGDKVFYEGRIWECTTPDNSFAPGVSGWHDAPLVGNPQWIQPTGAHDTYSIGDIVDHNGFTWESTYDNNTWEPGVFGWVQV